MTDEMIDYGTCSISNLQPYEESFLDGIRVIFKEHRMKEAMDLNTISNRQYKVDAMLDSIEESILDLLLLIDPRENIGLQKHKVEKR